MANQQGYARCNLTDAVEQRGTRKMNLNDHRSGKPRPKDATTNKLFGDAMSCWKPEFSYPSAREDYLSAFNRRWAGGSLIPVVKREGERQRVRSIAEICAFEDTLNDNDAIIALMFQVLQDVERTRKNAVIAHFSAIHYPRESIYLDDEDIERLNEIIRTIPNDITNVDFIVHSAGGKFRVAADIAKTLRNRFERVNVLIPREGRGAAMMAALSADEIITGKYAFLHQFTPQVLGSDGEYMDMNIFLSVARYVKFCLLFFPWTRNNCGGWTISSLNANIKEVKQARRNSERLAALWLTKYAFGRSSIIIKDDCSFSLFLSAVRSRFNSQSSKDYKRALKIARIFTRENFWRQDFFTRKDLEDEGIGMNISEADGELDDYMSEAYFLADKLVVRSSAAKIWLSSSDYRVIAGDNIIR
jgi:hypothetical protein